MLVLTDENDHAFHPYCCVMQQHWNVLHFLKYTRVVDGVYFYLVLVHLPVAFWVYVGGVGVFLRWWSPSTMWTAPLIFPYPIGE